jgi:hypothetical protein
VTGSILDDLADFFPDTIQLRRLTSKGPSGSRVYATEVELLPARISQGDQVLHDQTGREIASTVKAVLRGVFNVTTDDEFTLPERFNPRVPEALMVASITDESGPLYEVVRF